ncbi:hypothetical protein RUND412_010379 [Rhizina undulata]
MRVLQSTEYEFSKWICNTLYLFLVHYCFCVLTFKVFDSAPLRTAARAGCPVKFDVAENSRATWSAKFDNLNNALYEFSSEKRGGGESEQGENKEVGNTLEKLGRCKERTGHGAKEVIQGNDQGRQQAGRIREGMKPVVGSGITIFVQAVLCMSHFGLGILIGIVFILENTSLMLPSAPIRTLAPHAFAMGDRGLPRCVHISPPPLQSQRRCTAAQRYPISDLPSLRRVCQSMYNGTY